MARAAQALLLAISMLFALPGPVRAQNVPADNELEPDPGRARRAALELYQQSRERYGVGDYQGAIDLLDRAYALHPEPVLLYNLARAHGNLGNFEAAVDLFERYLEEAPDTEDREVIEERIRHYSGALEEQRAEEAEQERQRREAIARARREAAALESSGSGVAPWVIASAGGAVLVAGAIFGGLSQSERSAAEEESAFVAAEEASNRAVTYGWVANVSFGVGALLTLTGLAWGLVDLSLSSDTESEGESAMALGAQGLRISW